MNELPDRLLRDALRDRLSTASAVPSALCADADALAAWTDGTMSRPARTAFEAHAADCGRCQALMAAMARTEPPPVEAAWWRRSPFSWLMPLAAAAAAIVIVVDLATTERRAPAPAPSVARQDSTAAASVPPPTAAAPAPSPASPQRADAPRDELVGVAKSRPQQGAASRSIPNAAAGAPPAPKTESRAKDATATAAPMPAAAPAPAPPMPPPAAPAPAAARERAVPPLGDAATAATVETVRSESARGRALASLAMKAMAAPTVIVSPDRGSQWRIVNGTIEHTADGGRTWQAQPLDAGAPLRAGAAPTARVCWLVGLRGVVMLTTDGVTWRRIEFPDPIDLAAIEASDDSHATVTTATGRRYSTSDGGKSWTLQ
jgi:hypothetical protein